MLVDGNMMQEVCPLSGIRKVFVDGPTNVFSSIECLPLYFSNKFLAGQFHVSGLLNPRLRAVILYAAWFSEDMLNKPLIITHLFRTQAEQNSIYTDNKMYKTAPWKSVHQFGRGCDIRIRHLTETQQKHLRRKINTSFPYDAERSHPTAFLERSHLHLQVCALPEEIEKEYAE